MKFFKNAIPFIALLCVATSFLIVLSGCNTHKENYQPADARQIETIRQELENRSNTFSQTNYEFSANVNYSGHDAPSSIQNNTDKCDISVKGISDKNGVVYSQIEEYKKIDNGATYNAKASCWLQNNVEYYDYIINMRSNSLSGKVSSKKYDEQWAVFNNELKLSYYAFLRDAVLSVQALLDTLDKAVNDTEKYDILVDNNKVKIVRRNSASTNAAEIIYITFDNNGSYECKNVKTSDYKDKKRFKYYTAVYEIKPTQKSVTATSFENF